MENGRVELVPAGGIEIIAQRTNVCDRSTWTLGEASTTGIDSYIVKADDSGYYHIPQKSFSDTCSRVVLRGTAISPHIHSITALIAKDPVVGNPQLYGALTDSDVVLRNAAKGQGRVQELFNYLNQATGSYAVSSATATEVYSRYFAEICELYEAFPEKSVSLYEKAHLLLGKQCE
jgi:hypothetical protein